MIKSARVAPIAFSREWPQYPPYGGAYDTVIPHLTVWFARLVPKLISGDDPEPTRHSLPSADRWRGSNRHG